MRKPDMKTVKNHAGRDGLGFNARGVSQGKGLAAGLLLLAGAVATGPVAAQEQDVAMAPIEWKGNAPSTQAIQAARRQQSSQAVGRMAALDPGLPAAMPSAMPARPNAAQPMAAQADLSGSPELTSAPADGRSLSALQTGEQAILEGQSALARFAGKDVRLEGFTGVAGLSSDAAYVMTASGRAQIGDQSAGPGEILIILPYDEGVVSQRFDARRYIASLDGETRANFPQLVSDMTRVADRQQRGVFFGRLSPTAFNVAAPGSGNREQARRTILGNETVRELRFSSATADQTVESQVVDHFTRALVAGDRQTIASLLDPTPYGGNNIAGAAGEARLMVADRLLAREPWGQLLSGREFTQTADTGVWQVSVPSGQVVMRLTFAHDFIFVSNIKRGI